MLTSDTLGRPQSYKKYDEEKLSKAVINGMSVRRAAEEYGIPRSTLHNRVSGKVPFGAKSDTHRYLNLTEELELASFLSGLGHSKTKKQVIEIVQNLVDK